MYGKEVTISALWVAVVASLLYHVSRLLTNPFALQPLLEASRKFQSNQFGKCITNAEYYCYPLEQFWLSIFAFIICVGVGVFVMLLFCILRSTREAVSPLQSYKLLKRLGTGTYGSVYKAIRTCSEDDGTGGEKAYAIKVITLRSLMDANASISEAMKMACVDHRCVVKVHEQFVAQREVFGIGEIFDWTSPYQIYIVQELCSRDLESQIMAWFVSPEKRPSWPQLVRIFSEMVEGVNALHLKNIIHRDLKPANIFISSDHRHIKVGDLGLGVNHGYTATTAGTPGYMPPEVFENEPYATHTDIWALGCIMVDLAYPTQLGGWGIQAILEKCDSSTKYSSSASARQTSSAGSFSFMEQYTLRNIESWNVLLALIIQQVNEDEVAARIVRDCLQYDWSIRCTCQNILDFCDPAGLERTQSVAIESDPSNSPCATPISS